MASQSAHPNRDVWYAVFGTGHPELKKYQEFNLRLPSPPRCKLCYAPYGGVGKVIMKLQNRAPSSRNPLFCSRCDEFLRKFPGGAEVEMTIVFIDVRGSTGLAQKMAPAEFSLAMQSFYNDTFPVFNAHDGFITDVRGDGALVTFPPGFSGADHASKAIDAVKAVLGLPILAPDGSTLGLGAGVHTGVAYIGTMTGKGTGVEDITVLGDAPNVASHLCTVARSGEALVSDAARAAASLDYASLERRDITVKDRTESVNAYVVTAT